MLLVLRLLPSLIVINVIRMQSSPQAFYRAGSACEAGISRDLGPPGDRLDNPLTLGILGIEAAVGVLINIVGTYYRSIIGASQCLMSWSHAWLTRLTQRKL
jgi:hypothetical protein